MPKIPPRVIDSVFYLYANREDALAGKNPGGTGFVVEYRGGVLGRTRLYYGVTNWHVACRNGDSVIRLNNRGGGIDVIELGPEDWEFLPGRYDVAAVPVSVDNNVHEVSSIPTHMFVEERSHQIGVGEDTFMIGLFLDHDGIITNVPSARFGHVSMLPNPHATIEQPTGYRGVSYVVDMHSRTGFSGSPVFAYRTFGSDLTELFGHRFDHFELDDPSSRTRKSGSLTVHTMFKFLGIHWGQFPEMWELHDKSKLQESRKSHLVTEGGYVEGMSGMTCVIPAWHVLEPLDIPKLKTPREEAFAEDRGHSNPKPEAVDE
jgi:hypothetical protein